MHYFVTGATGFIGKRLVDKLLERGHGRYLLVRKESAKKLDALREYWGAGQDARGAGHRRPRRSRSSASPPTTCKKLKGKDRRTSSTSPRSTTSTADEESRRSANIDGTRNAVEFAKAIDAGCFHHVSSIAAAGLYEGVFREDMFEEAEDLDHPYFKTKHESEKIVRNECKVPWRVYRPGFVVGDSKTGEIDKIDGPYYFFKLIQRMRQLLPPWMPTIGIEGGRINIVPVDFVVDALDHIAHKKGLDGKCFHLADPEPYRIGDVLNIFAKAAHAPQMTMRINAALFGFIPRERQEGADGAGAGAPHPQRGAEGPRHARGHVQVRQLADALRQPRGAGGAEGLGHRGARRSSDYALAAVGLLGAPPRPRPVHRPHACRAR